MTKNFLSPQNMVRADDYCEVVQRSSNLSLSAKKITALPPAVAKATAGKQTQWTALAKLTTILSISQNFVPRVGVEPTSSKSKRF